MKLSSLLIAGLTGGAVMALLSSLPVILYGNCLGCMWVWLSGIGAAWLYRYSAGRSHAVTAGQGAVVGILSGFIGAIGAAILGAIFGSIGMASLLQSMSTGPDDPFSSISGLGGVEFGVSTALIGLLFTIFLFPLFGAIGGAIGGVIFGKPATTA